MPIYLRLLAHTMVSAVFCALSRLGNRMATSDEMIEMMTSSSIRVNAGRLCVVTIGNLRLVQPNCSIIAKLFQNTCLASLGYGTDPQKHQHRKSI